MHRQRSSWCGACARPAARNQARSAGIGKPLLADHEDVLRELAATRKGITLAEIRDALIERGIQPGSLTTIWWTLRRLGLTHKKALHAAEQERPDVAEHRRFWRVWQRYMDATSLVFIDETGASTSMVRHYGWHPRGERLVDAVSSSLQS